jgi:superoxide dismutase, Cu-Zn family
MMRAVLSSLTVSVCTTMLLAGCGGDTPAGDQTGETAPGVTDTGTAENETTAELRDPEGSTLGTVTLTEVGEAIQVSVEATGLQPGFHGFHVHAIGVCEADSQSPTDPSMTGDFLSAGGHLGAGETDHGEHVGDLPSLFVSQSGEGQLTAVTDAFTIADLMDDDGSAFMVHAGRDNFANIPERYAPGGPDEMTRNTGDAGGRIACGALTS